MRELRPGAARRRGASNERRDRAGEEERTDPERVEAATETAGTREHPEKNEESDDGERDE